MSDKSLKIGYIRVSTVEQNTIRQLDGIQLDKIFTDRCSGKDTKRPELKYALEFAREGDTFVVHSMDRLARNLDDLRKLVTDLTTKGVKVQFIKENILFKGDDSPMSNMLLSIIGAVAQFERELINERIREGVAAAKKAGKYKARGKQYTQEQLDEICQMAADRYKITEIAKKFNACRGTIYKYLKK